MQEEWRDIEFYEGLYQVSNLGNVRRTSTQRLIARQKARLRGGYWVVNLWKLGGRRCLKVHRLVAVAFIGKSPKGHVVNHIDNDPSNSHVTNLEYVTPSGNVQHAMKTTGAHLGEKHHMAKLTENDVRAIRASQLSSKELAIKFNVSVTNVQVVRSRRGWKHVA